MTSQIIAIVLLILIIVSWYMWRMYSKNKAKIIWFYSESCIHCTNMQPAWDQFVAMKPAGVSIMKVNTATNQAMSKDYGVDGVPYIVLEINGKRKVYNGDRSAADLYKFSMTKI